MANRERGEVELVVGGVSYTLRMSINAVADIEELLDKGINDIAAMVRNPTDFRIGTWRVLLWGALREFHKVTLEEAGEIMGSAGIDVVVDVVGEAMKAAFPAADEGKPENPRKASRKVRQGLLRHWMIETGGTRPEFWSSTLREIALDLEVSEARQVRDEQTRRWHTWHIAALPNVKTFPQFKDFLGPVALPATNAARHQTPEQQEVIARQWVAAQHRRQPPPRK